MTSNTRPVTFFPKTDPAESKSLCVGRYVLLLLAFSALAVQSCVIVGVDYQTPGAKTPDAWTRSLQGDVTGRRSSLEKWWNGYNDPTLDQLIERTRSANPNLKIASQSIAEARALRGAEPASPFGGWKWILFTNQKQPDTVCCASWTQSFKLLQHRL